MSRYREANEQIEKERDLIAEGQSLIALIAEGQSLIADARKAEPSGEKTRSLIFWCNAMILAAEARIQWWEDWRNASD